MVNKQRVFRRWPFQWPSLWTSMKTRKAGLAGIGFLAGVLLLGSWNMPFPTQAAISQPTASSAIGSSPNMDKGGFADIAQAVTPAVVNITVRKEGPVPMSGMPSDPMREFFGIPGMPEMPGMPNRPGTPPMPEAHGAGSGVIVSSDGYVLTNDHVVDGAKEITVTLPDNREFSGKVVGLDPQTDLAVVKIDAANLPFVPWGNSADLRVGEYVLAVGNPFGLNSTVTLGIVSALGRGGMGITQYEDFIQTDAAINPGNSGGALVNTRGELIGINTAIFSQSGGYQGVGFAVPTNLAKPVYESLISTGKVVRGFLGVGIQAVTTDLAQSFQLDQIKGALVTNVVPGSPADEAGMKRGDVIVEYQGKPVLDPRNLQHQVIRTTVGSEVKMVVIRDGRKHTLKTRIRQQDNPTRVAQASSVEQEGPLAGVAVQNLDNGIAQQLGLEKDVNGVVVMEVTPGSYAARAGLIQGDVISEINRKPVRSEEDFVKVVSHLKEHSSALIFIHRGKGALYLTIKI
ncbi:MAG: DegQ family serine endoprotease [Nitrospirota bacterium]|nr:DegQ family serine endoprotease [Nitrospirota bacterium]MDH4361722.1 DegQ family serine endoprotease [Nitrospirota bacterium]MDH5575008.1 DegQ family serine endoprotease [Nitrospirota bacterium]